MKGVRLDLARLAREGKCPGGDPYLVVGRMLRDHLGGDVLAEVRERSRRDPRLRAMPDHTLAEAEAPIQRMERP